MPGKVKLFAINDFGTPKNVKNVLEQPLFIPKADTSFSFVLV